MRQVSRLANGIQEMTIRKNCITIRKQMKQFVKKYAKFLILSQLVKSTLARVNKNT